MPIALPTDIARRAIVAVNRTCTPPAVPVEMMPPQVAAVCQCRSRHLDADGLRDLLEAKIESERVNSSHWTFDAHRLIALRQALSATGAEGFAQNWDSWRMS